MNQKRQGILSSYTLRIAALLTATIGADAQAATVSMTDPLSGGIGYRATVQLGGFDTASFSRHVGAWSWEDNDLFGPGEDAVGWTHTSDWVALKLDAPTTLTIRMQRQEGVATGPSTFAGTSSLFPSFTIWSNWDNDGTDFHMYNNHGPVDWAEDLVYMSHVNNSTQTFSEATWSLPAGEYSMALGSNAPATDPVRQGYLVTFTAVPEPSSALCLAAGFAALLGRFRARRTAGI
jgi:hypothetical protein